MTPTRNRWHSCLLPDNYRYKLKQDLAEATADPDTRVEPEEGQDDEVSVRPLGDGGQCNPREGLG